MSNNIPTLPEFTDLAPYWRHYFLENDAVIQENFWGNLTILKLTEYKKDPYIAQLKEMGYCFETGKETPASFYQAVAWIFAHITHFITQGILNTSEVLWPARVFQLNNKYVPCIIGEEPPKHAQELDLVTPDIFVDMVGNGFFPIGSHIRKHTNQCLAEHDLAHFAGFICAPEYMRLIRKGFLKVSKKMKSNFRIKKSLQDFNSIYSLRLYYIIEVLTLIPENRKGKLQELVGLDIESPLDLELIIGMLEEKAKNPAALYQYLYKIYDAFYDLVEPVGGESRDILNRVRKFNRANRLGIYYSQQRAPHSKFDGSSIYSLYQNGCAALENKRSTHPDFLTALREIHAPFIGTLIGTSQLNIADWVMQAVEERPRHNSKLYQYLCNSKMWNESHLIYWAYGCTDCTKVIDKESEYYE